MTKYIFSLLFAMLYISVYTQNTATGTITDKKNNTPLGEVSIYFPQIEKGTISNSNGKYEFNNLPPGDYKIIISFLGYKTISRPILIEKTNSIFNFQLEESAIEMEEVIVSTPFHKLQSENVMKVERHSIKEMHNQGAVNLSQGITNIPGVESVSTGLGIGKPVIRGLSSNRVLVYNQNIRLENQQFGDEHGLGISDSGIESVEVIKGPASLLYGSDALGGVLYINPEKFAAANTSDGDINGTYYSNTEGYNFNIGAKTSGKNLKFLVRGGFNTHLDYTNGDNKQVTNTRFNDKDFKTGVGYQGKRINTELRYNYNISSLGIPEEIGIQSDFRTPLEPYQEIENNTLSSKSTFFFNNSSLKTTFGYTSNSRKEFEDHHHEDEDHEEDEHEEEEEEHGEEEPALDMRLNTFSYNILYNFPKMGIFETIIGVQGMSQENKNLGEEVLIPDATTIDYGILSTSHIHFNDKNDVQIGLRFDNRSITSRPHGDIDDDNYINSLNKDFNSFNFALGYKTNLSQALTLRLNLASGFRAPNLAELTSNGSHEGTNRYEIGDQNLKHESNFQTDFSLEYKNVHFEFFANTFYNSINDYIYIQANGTTIDENAVFVYLQDDAKLYGGELGLHLHPHPLDWLHLESNFAMVRGELNEGSNLSLIPADNFTSTLGIELAKPNKNAFLQYAFITLKSYLKQNNVGPFETRSDAYSLLSIGLEGNFKIFNKYSSFRLTGTNILDKNYISHLSRLKTDGISNMGRNIVFGVILNL